MLWNAGGTLAFELGTTSNQLAIPGWLASGGGTREFVFTSGPGLAEGNTYTLATFGATNLTAANLTFSGLPADLTGEFILTQHSITFRVVAAPVATSVTTPTGAFGWPFWVMEFLNSSKQRVIEVG